MFIVEQFWAWKEDKQVCKQVRFRDVEKGKKEITNPKPVKSDEIKEESFGLSRTRIFSYTLIQFNFAYQSNALEFLMSAFWFN